MLWMSSGPWGLPVGFLLLRFSFLFTVEFLPLLSQASLCCGP